MVRRGLAQFIDGASIKWGRLAAVLGGVIFGEILGGVATVIDALFSIPEGLLNGLGNFNADVVETVLDGPIAAIESGGPDFVGFVELTGTPAFVVAVAGVAVTAYGLAYVRGGDLL